MKMSSLISPVVLVLCGSLIGCQGDADEVPEVAAVAPNSSSLETPPALKAVSTQASAGQLAVLEVLSEGGEVRDGVLTVDAYEGDRLWMGVMLETEAGTPLADQTIQFEPRGTEISPPPQVIAAQPITDGDGYMEFQVIVSDAGTYPVTVAAAGVRREFQVNVIPNDFDQWLQGVSREGVMPWNSLMKTRVALDDEGLMVASYPPDIAALNGKTVRLAGFMLPLDTDPAQRHFLLSASPPSCFFHVPGGPATVVEVFADQHPVMGTFDPLVVEGELTLVERSDAGILFQLRQAKLSDKVPKSGN